MSPEEIDNMLFNLEIKLGQLCDKKSKVSYKDIFKEITDLRIDIRNKYLKSK